MVVLLTILGNTYQNREFYPCRVEVIIILNETRNLQRSLFHQELSVVSSSQSGSTSDSVIWRHTIQSHGFGPSNLLRSLIIFPFGGGSPPLWTISATPSAFSAAIIPSVERYQEGGVGARFPQGFYKICPEKRFLQDHRPNWPSGAQQAFC